MKIPTAIRNRRGTYKQDVLGKYTSPLRIGAICEGRASARNRSQQLLKRDVYVFKSYAGFRYVVSMCVVQAYTAHIL